MKREYLGTVSRTDALYEILHCQCPDVSHPRFHVERMSHRDVYRYWEERTGESFVGKFFSPDDPDTERIERKKGEFDNLRRIRTYGFDRPPHIIVRPIVREEAIGLAVMEEFVQGKDLDHFLRRAVHNDGATPLMQSLCLLASFLFSLHSRTRGTDEARTDQPDAHFEKILDKLCRQMLLSHNDRCLIVALKERWLARLSAKRVRGVTIHGDATPTNFIFSPRHGVVAIDLERMKAGDAGYDVGMLCGELKHAFAWRGGNPGDAEPFIRHFLACYCRGAPDPRHAFHEITARLPFYMALTELRIARNEYLDRNYRQRLIAEAIECLRWGLVIT